jgi:REP element-mobilizing transposase RayT
MAMKTVKRGAGSDEAGAGAAGAGGRGGRARWRQLGLDQARKPVGHGGWRPGAGRPRGRTTVSHDGREGFAARFPLHVTLRVIDGLPSLRRDDVLAAVRAAIEAGGRAEDFRVVEFNVLANHLHLVVEAAGKRALARGMNGLTIRLARRINKLLGRRGRLFAARYHARVLRTPREVKNVLRYVLLNARHHAAERGRRLARGWVDPCSSAPWFEGWREPSPSRAPWLLALRRLARPTAAARSWLLDVGWRRHGLLVVDDAPGPAPSVVAEEGPPARGRRRDARTSRPRARVRRGAAGTSRPPPRTR